MDPEWSHHQRRGGPITGAGLVPYSWRSTHPSGHMRLAGDTRRPGSRTRDGSPGVTNAGCDDAVSALDPRLATGTPDGVCSSAPASVRRRCTSSDLLRISRHPSDGVSSNRPNWFDGLLWPDWSGRARREVAPLARGSPRRETATSRTEGGTRGVRGRTSRHRRNRSRLREMPARRLEPASTRVERRPSGAPRSS